MSWNYRLMKRREGDEDVYAVHEVYYDKNGRIDGYTESPVYPSGETWLEFQNDFTNYNIATQCPPSKVLDYDALEAESARARPLTDGERGGESG